MPLYFIYVVTMINAIGQFALMIVVSLFALKLGAGPVMVGLLGGASALFPTVLAVHAGRWVDRHGAKWPMTGGALALLIAALAPGLFPGFPALFVSGLMTGVAIILVNLGAQNLVGLLSTQETRARAFSNYTLIIATASFLGPLIGGFAIDQFGYQNTFLFLAVFGLIDTILLLVFAGRLLPGGTRAAGKAGGGIRSLMKDPVVRRMLIVGMLVNAGINVYQIYLPVYGVSINLSASTIGIILAMNSAAAFVARFGLPQLIRRFGENRLLAYCFVCGTIGLALIPLFESPWILGFISFFFGLGMGCGQPIVIIMMFSNSRDGRSGESLGLKFAVNQLVKLVGPVMFGAIAAVGGLLAMFWSNAALMAVGGKMSGPPRKRPTP